MGELYTLRMHFTFTFLLVFFLSTSILFSQWDPHAGLISSHIDPYASLLASSNSSGTLQKIIDKDQNSQWISDKPLPSNYINRPDQNTLFQKGESLFTSTGGTAFSKLTDGNLGQLTNVNAENGNAWLNINWQIPQPLLLMHIKARTTVDIKVFAFFSPSDSVLIGTYPSHKSYSLMRFDIQGDAIKKISLQADESFQLFEVSGMAQNPKEYVVVDFGRNKSIGLIKTRHWAGHNVAEATKIYVSTDNQFWEEIATLDPNSLNENTTIVDPPVMGRYLKVEHTLFPKDYKNVYVWEVDAYDGEGLYGGMPAAQSSTVTLGEFLGVNTIWGWGHNEYADMLETGEGPDLHKDYASHTRFYHNMSWDVTDPDNPIDYQSMENGNGTQAQWWLDWNREFQAIEDAGMKLQSTIKIENFPASSWDNPYESAYNYGYAFAQYFGQTGNGLIEAVEVGNEPWAYESGVYRQILSGMAQGIKAADPTMKVLPCALQASDPTADNTEKNKHYIGTKVTESEAPYLDALNAHAYSFSYDANGTRIGVHPESEQSSFRELLSLIRFRDRNMPGKPIHLTEWGWDMAGAGEDCTHGECVSERAGTAYAVRAAMMALRLGITRAAWYFYGNFGESSLWSRSGLTGSEKTGFEKKNAFRAFETMKNTLGDRRFLQVVREDEEAWMYLLGDQQGNPTHLVAWRPIDGDDESTITINWDTDFFPTSAIKIGGLNPNGETISLPNSSNGTMKLNLSAVPVVIALQRNSEIQMATQNVVYEGNHNYDAPVEKVQVDETYNETIEGSFANEWNEIPLDNVEVKRMDITVFPNPTADFINLDFEDELEYYTVQIVDMSGRILLNQQENIQTDSIRLNVKQLNLKAGNYIIRVKPDDDLPISEQFTFASL